MRSNKIIIYVGLLAVGLLFGWLLFGGTSNETKNAVSDSTEQSNTMWTCSMHPQIMQPEPGDCPICGMDLIPAKTGADGLAADQFKLTDNAMALANVQTTIVGKGLVGDNKVKLSGEIVENEEANAVQVSYFSGRIERLNVNFTGEEVRKGQLLATIYSPELYAAQQELITAAALKESQPALYKAVRNKLKLWKLSENQIQQIENSGNVIENFPVYATVSGTVTEKLVEQGDYVIQGQPLLKIADLSTVWASFDVYENQIDLFKKGQDVTVFATAYPNKQFTGKVSFIDPVLNSNTRTVNLRVVLDNKNNRFKPGMFVTAEVEGELTESGSVITIPASSVMWTGERSVIYLKTDPNAPVFEMQEVVLGNKLGDTYEVVEGIFAGNEIVTNGTFTIDAAAQLQGKKSMMNKDGKHANLEHKHHSNSNDDKTSTENYSESIKRIKVSEEFQGQLKAVFNSYIALKNALVNEEVGNSAKASNKVLENLTKVDMGLLKNEKAHSDWMAIESQIKSNATSIAQTSDLNKQRTYFKPLSLVMIKAVQQFGVNEMVYVEFCPMADKNKGAYWLSKEEKVINPYFGEAMLTCGEVKQILK